MALAQALHFVASTAFGSLQNGHVFDVAGSAAASSLMNILEIHQTRNAMTTNAINALMNRP